MHLLMYNIRVRTSANSLSFMLYRVAGAHERDVREEVGGSWVEGPHIVCASELNTHTPPSLLPVWMRNESLATLKGVLERAGNMSITTNMSLNVGVNARRIAAHPHLPPTPPLRFTARRKNAGAPGKDEGVMYKNRMGADHYGITDSGESPLSKPVKKGL